MANKADLFSLAVAEITVDPHIAAAFMAVNKRDLMLTRESLKASVDASLERGAPPSDDVQNVLMVAFRVFGREEAHRLADELRRKVIDQEPTLLSLMQSRPS